MKGSRERCGCRSTDSKWLELCPTHKAEHDETHKRWNQEKTEREERKRLKEWEENEDALMMARLDDGAFDEAMMGRAS